LRGEVNMVRLIESWGSDEQVANIASLSYGHEKAKDSERLLERLIKNNHMSVFEFAGVTFYVETSIIVQRQWMRHRHLSYLEQSLRYVKTPDLEFMINNDRFNSEDMSLLATNSFKASIEIYNMLLDNGVSAEVARSVLPLGFKTKFYTSGNLRSWLQFLQLRLANDAQEEIRTEAKQVLELLRERFPITMSIFESHLAHK